MIRALIWTEAPIAGFPDAWKTIEWFRQHRIHSVIMQNLHATMLGDFPKLGWHVDIWQWGAPPRRLDEIMGHLWEKDRITSNQIGMVVDNSLDLSLAKRSNVLPLVVRTGEFRLRAADQYKPIIDPLVRKEQLAPSFNFIPGVVDRLNQTERTAGRWGGGSAA